MTKNTENQKAEANNNNNSDIQQNPFVQVYLNKSWGSFDDSICFEKIQINHYMPALEQGIQWARENISKIKTNSAQANFENTIIALENASELQELVSNVYFNLFSAEASDAHQALAKEISPKLAAFSSEVSLDEDLFKKIKEVYDNRSHFNLSQEETMLLDKTYKSFVRNGALLNPSDKEKLRQIDQELSVLSPQFSENVLKATNAFELIIDNESDLAGLPESVKEASAHEASQKGYEGKWLFTLQAPSLIPFMQYSEKRELRKKLWLASSSKAYQGEFSNQEIILKSVKLKNERAQLLGFRNHADFTLQERMAETTDRVFNFLDKLLSASKSAAMKDIEELKSFAKKRDGLDEVFSWDFAFYSEKLKESKFNFSEEELRPYFKLENVIAGVFEHATKLYDLQFNKLNNVSKYHPDVDVYEVKDANTGNYIGLFYTDFFPRKTKKDGAWMTQYRDQGFYLGQLRAPHVSIVCNFTKPTPTKPSLISYDEVLTLFHEFGHALHGLLSKCHFRSLSGPNVYWDFVELPSQIMENWVKEKEGLDLFAKHYETGEAIPKELVEKIKKSNQFQAGYYSMRQLTFAFLDMNWHTTDPSKIKDVTSFEIETTKDLRLFPYVEGTCVSTSFSHIFAGGYSAGYYSYKWAEVLDADAFEYFKTKGIFNKEVASKFKENILSKGGTDYPMNLYKKFRGQEPDPNALLRREGLLQ